MISLYRYGWRCREIKWQRTIVLSLDGYSDYCRNERWVNHCEDAPFTYIKEWCIRTGKYTRMWQGGKKGLSCFGILPRGWLIPLGVLWFRVLGSVVLGFSVSCPVLHYYGQVRLWPAYDYIVNEVVRFVSVLTKTDKCVYKDRCLQGWCTAGSHEKRRQSCFRIKILT